MASGLAQFTVTSEADGYRMIIETEDGQRLEAIADCDQLDLIAETIDELLDADEDEAPEVEEAG